MSKSHIFNPDKIELLESEDRRVWQNPEEILGFVKIPRNSVVADLGSGSGYFTIPLSKMADTVYAIDVQKRMLEYLEQKIQKLKIDNIKLLLSTEKGIPLKDETIDVLITVNTLHEFNEKEVMIIEIKRVLKIHGKVIIVDFQKEDMSFGPPNHIRVSQEDAIDLFKKNGFNLLKSVELKYHYLLIFQKE